jgi:hypothetical protein
MNTDRRDTAVVFMDPQNYHGCPAGAVRKLVPADKRLAWHDRTPV